MNGQQAGGVQRSSPTSPAGDVWPWYHDEGEESRGEQGEKRGGEGEVGGGEHLTPKTEGG